jgi:hypothetical protein
MKSNAALVESLTGEIREEGKKIREEGKNKD